MKMEKEISFEDVCRYVAHQLPEADRLSIFEFLKKNSSPPYTLSSAYYYVREIEKLMYL